MKRILITLIFSFLILIPLYPYQGKVVGISDGDTITVLNNKQQIKIRLYGIDTPEKHQDFGQKAKQFTSNMVFGKSVKVETITKDRYGRSVSLVYIDDKCLNEELVKMVMPGYTQHIAMNRIDQSGLYIKIMPR